MSDRNGSAAAHRQATAEPHDSQTPAEHAERLAAALVEPEEVTLSRDEPPGTDFGGVGDWYEREHPRRGPNDDAALAEYVSLSGEPEAFDCGRARGGWFLDPEPGADGREVLGSLENLRALWRTEDNRWVLFSESDGNGREVTQKKAAWLLRCDKQKLPPGVPPVLKDPDRESAKPKPKGPAIRVDVERCIVFIDDFGYGLNTSNKILFVKMVAKRNGETISFPEMKKLCLDEGKELTSNPSLIRSQLPREVRELIGSKACKGYFLKRGHYTD